MGSNSTESKGDLSPDCLELLSLVLDQAATPEQHLHFREHLKSCMPCYQQYNLDLAIKKLIQEKCCDKRVPEGLVASIREKVIHLTD